MKKLIEWLNSQTLSAVFSNGELLAVWVVALLAVWAVALLGGSGA